MNTVIDFPTKTVREKVLLERSISDFLDGLATDRESKSKLTERLLAIFATYQQDYTFDFDIECPPTITNAQADIIEASSRENFVRFEKLVHDHLNRILHDRFQTEIKIFSLESEGDSL